MTIRTLALTLLVASLLSTPALAEPVDIHVDYGGPRAVPHEHGDIYSFGRPGQEKHARRTITLTSSDNMRYSESTLDFAQGDTVKFVFTNAGSKPHEFVLADKRTQDKVEKARPDPESVKSPPYSLLLAPGETFVYTSGTQLRTAAGVMRGSMFVVAEDGTRFEADVPAFVLDASSHSGGSGQRVLH